MKKMLGIGNEGRESIRWTVVGVCSYITGSWTTAGSTNWLVGSPVDGVAEGGCIALASSHHSIWDEGRKVAVLVLDPIPLPPKAVCLYKCVSSVTRAVLVALKPSAAVWVWSFTVTCASYSSPLYSTVLGEIQNVWCQKKCKGAWRFILLLFHSPSPFEEEWIFFYHEEEWIRISNGSRIRDGR